MRLAIPIASAALLALSSGASSLQAEPLPTAALRYERDSSAMSCPDRETLTRGVAARLGRDAFRMDSDRSLVVQVAALGSGFQADIKVYDDSGDVIGTRELITEAADCAELLSALELAIAIAIDPLYNMPKAPSEPAVVTVAVEVPEPAVRSDPPPPPSRVDPVEASLGAGLHVAGSSEPDSTLGITGQYKERRSVLAWAVEGRFDLPSEVPAVAGGVIATQITSASGLLCMVSTSLEVCGLLSLGVLRSAGHTYADSRSVTTPYGALGGRLGYRVALRSSFALEFGADLLARLQRTTLLVDEEVAWESAPYEISFGLRGLWRIH